MDRQSLVEYHLTTYGTSPDYLFDEGFETAVLRRNDDHKWYAPVMRVSRRKLGIDSEEVIDVVNLNCQSRCSAILGRAMVSVLSIP